MEGTMATIMLFAGNFEPRFWAFCSGQLIGISQNSALFALLGTTYGGDGRVNFALPDFRGRVPIGAQVDQSNLGARAGAEQATMSIQNMPQHTHGMTPALLVSTSGATSEEADSNILAAGSAYVRDTSKTNGNLGGATSTPTGLTGSSTPFAIRNPYLGLNFVICTQGIFPSRN
jgi:microcystin-dependent protein